MLKVYVVSAVLTIQCSVDQRPATPHSNKVFRRTEEAGMKWIVLLIVGAVVAYWLYQGRRKNNIEDPDMKTFEEKDYYLKKDDDSSSSDRNPRH